ncbi:EF-hand domain-containing protein [Christiangramia marina]|uniref:EF-hand domain-containing protein n=1 Tax=Christiangramia marina TaxID=409436 RepID=UPI003AA8A461
MKVKKGILAFLFIVGSVIFSTTQAQQGKERKERPTFAELLEKMDTNEDGKLAKKEVKGPLKKVFDKVDTNDDRFISEEEFKKAPKPDGKKQRN